MYAATFIGTFDEPLKGSSDVSELSSVKNILCVWAVHILPLIGHICFSASWKSLD